MRAAVMMARIADASPRLKARIAGALYLLSFLTAAFSELFARGVLRPRGAHLRGSSIATSGREPRHSVRRILLPPDRLPHFQGDLPAASSRHADDIGQSGLADLAVKPACEASVPLQSGRRRPRGTVGVPVAPRDGSKRSEVERAGNCAARESALDAVTVDNVRCRAAAGR
jgi:hypothetical protein